MTKKTNGSKKSEHDSNEDASTLISDEDIACLDRIQQHLDRIMCEMMPDIENPRFPELFKKFRAEIERIRVLADWGTTGDFKVTKSIAHQAETEFECRWLPYEFAAERADAIERGPAIYSEDPAERGRRVMQRACATIMAERAKNYGTPID